MRQCISSKETYPVPKAVALKVNELGLLLCSVGDEEAGTLLKDVCSTPDLLSLRTAFLKVGRADRSLDAIETPLQTDISPKELRLREFVSLEGLRLHPKMTYEKRREYTGLQMSNSYIYRLVTD
ncbi:hypothetical protein WAI453_000828 [Rhynchosporium graminicola]